MKIVFTVSHPFRALSTHLLEGTEDSLGHVHLSSPPVLGEGDGDREAEEEEEEGEEGGEEEPGLPGDEAPAAMEG